MQKSFPVRISLKCAHRVMLSKTFLFATRAMAFLQLELLQIDPSCSWVLSEGTPEPVLYFLHKAFPQIKIALRGFVRISKIQYHIWKFFKVPRKWPEELIDSVSVKECDVLSASVIVDPKRIEV